MTPREVILSTLGRHGGRMEHGELMVRCEQQGLSLGAAALTLGKLVAVRRVDRTQCDADTTWYALTDAPTEPAPWTPRRALHRAAEAKARGDDEAAEWWLRWVELQQEVV